MIIGLGSDLCDIRRIEHMLERHGPRFTERLFTATERAYADAKPPAAAPAPTPSASRPRRLFPRPSERVSSKACSCAI